MIRKILFIYLLIQTLFVSALFAIDMVNIDAISNKAKSENKHLLLFFHKEHCGFCKKMKNVTLEDPKVKGFIDKQFIVVDVGINDEGTIQHKDFNGTKYEYAKSLGISLYPSVGFIDGNNTLVYGTIGYRESEAFELILNYVQSKAYIGMELEAYKDELEFTKEE